MDVQLSACTCTLYVQINVYIFSNSIRVHVLVIVEYHTEGHQGEEYMAGWFLADGPNPSCTGGLSILTGE